MLRFSGINYSENEMMWFLFVCVSEREDVSLHGV